MLITLNEKIKNIKNEIKDLSQNSFFFIEFSADKKMIIVIDLILKTIKENKLNNVVYIFVNRKNLEVPEYQEYFNQILSSVKEYIQKNNIKNIQIIQKELSAGFFYFLIGKGYPIPDNNLKWCNDKFNLKIKKKTKEEIIKKHKNLKSIEITEEIVKDFETKDIWEYLDKNIEIVNKDIVLNYYSNNFLIGDNDLTMKKCWFCPLIKENTFLKNKYPLLEDFRKHLLNEFNNSLESYKINYYFDDQLIKTRYTMNSREYLLNQLIEILKKVKNPFDFISKEELIQIQKEHIKEGWLTLNVLKKIIEIDNDKKLKSFITSTDSINVLFPRFKEIQKYQVFNNISVSEFCIGIARRILLEEEINYGYRLKDLNQFKASINDLKINEKLKKEYFELKEKANNTTNSDEKKLLNMSLKVMYNFLYYLHKFD